MGDEQKWWRDAYRHLIEARVAVTNAMAHNVDDQAKLFAILDKLEEVDKIAREVMREKGITY